MDSGAKAILYTLLVSMGFGVLVVFFNPDYRIPQIIASNSEYYPGTTDSLIEQHAAEFVRPQPTSSRPAATSKKSSYKTSSNKSATAAPRRAKPRKPTIDDIGKININTADKQELMLLPGIGAVTADNILQYREEYKKFNSVEEITNVKGIGKGTLQKLEKYLECK